LPIPPLLVGDFNCVLHPIDRSSNTPVPRYATSHTLPALLSAASYSDSFRVLHPTTRVFSIHMRGFVASRLDRIYIPPLLESRPRVARYLPGTSDHHAYFLRLETAGLAVLPSLASKRSASLYWKLNSSVLSDPTFLPAFRTFWRPLADSRPRPPDGPDSTASTASQPPSTPPLGTPNPPPRTPDPPPAPSSLSAPPGPNPDPVFHVTDLPSDFPPSSTPVPSGPDSTASTASRPPSSPPPGTPNPPPRTPDPSPAPSTRSAPPRTQFGSSFPCYGFTGTSYVSLAFFSSGLTSSGPASLFPPSGASVFPGAL
jgi:hypothetical protein